MFPDVAGQELQHKSLVEPVFLVYQLVSSGFEERISLMQIACAVVQTLNDVHSVDAVQPMRTGWLIYFQTQADWECLVVQGLTIAGNYIQLQNDLRSSARMTVKITLRDLPLHAVDNAQVLEVLSEH